MTKKISIPSAIFKLFSEPGRALQAIDEITQQMGYARARCVEMWVVDHLTHGKLQEFTLTDYPASVSNLKEPKGERLGESTLDCPCGKRSHSWFSVEKTADRFTWTLHMQEESVPQAPLTMETYEGFKGSD